MLFWAAKMARIRFCFLVAALAVTACSSDPIATRDAHLKRGDDYMSTHKVAEAIVEYKLAVQADPKSGPARLKLGEAYIEQRDALRAYREMILAADLMPDDVSVQLKAGEILLRVGRFDDAKGRAEKVLAIDPKNVDAIIIRGNALAGLKDLGGALVEIERAIQTDPTKGAGYSNLGAVQLAQGDVPAAEASFKRALAINPKSTNVRLALANLYWASGRRKEAEDALKEGLALEPNNVVANQALAVLYLGSGRVPEAEAPLKLVAQHSPTPAGKLSLADYYIEVRRMADGKAIYQEVGTGEGQYSATAKLRLAALGLSEGDRAGAHKLIDEILAKNPGHVEALVAKAQLQFSEGKIQEALTTARLATQSDVNSALAHFVLAQILRSQYQNDEAEAAYKDAVRAGAGFAPANVELSRLALLSGANAEAVTYAQAAIDRAPGYGEAYLLLARAQTGAGNPKAAEAPVRLLVANFPDDPQVQAELGRLLLAKSDMKGAEAAFSRALAKEPLNLPALEGMLVLEIRTGRQAAARKRLDAAIASAPQNAELALLAGRVYATSFGDAAGGEKLVQKAIDLDPNNLGAFNLLGRMLVRSSDLTRATEMFEELVKRQPRSVGNITALGLLYHVQNKLDKAKAAYERVLQIDPKAPVASNNLAQMFVDRNENLDVALTLAETAKAGLPDYHEVDDTLGWIYYKKGLGQAAVTSFKAAVQKAPDNALYIYRLGLAHLLNKDKAAARQALEKALSKGNFPGADDARKVLASLKG